MLESNKPNLFVIAGPNGAGKTTTALTLLPNELKLYEFVNADEIARGLSPLNPSSVDELAGRLMIERIKDFIRQKKSFAFESTLSGTAWLRRVREARSAGFHTHLLFLYLKTSSIAVNRVKSRALIGGHSVPSIIVRRRYERGLVNLVRYYGSEFSTVLICDNSGGRPVSQQPVLKIEDGEETISNVAIWNSILRKAHAKKAESINDKLLRGVISAKAKLYAQAAVDGRALVFEEGGKIVKRVPLLDVSHLKKRKATR